MDYTPEVNCELLSDTKYSGCPQSLNMIKQVGCLLIATNLHVFENLPIITRIREKCCMKIRSVMKSTQRWDLENLQRF